MSDRQPEEFQKPVPLGETEPGELTPPKARITTFTSLKNRNYRWFWLGMLGSFAGLQMQIVARGWLVWTMTESELSIGIVMFAFGVPILLFAIFGGAIADRVNKRNLLIATQTFMAFLTAIIAILVTLNIIEFWHLVAVAVCTGFAFVLNGPARQSIIPELVKKRELLNAISLNATGMNLMRVIALALGGALIPVIGIDGVYYTIVVCYILGAASLFRVSLPQRGAAPTPAPAMANPMGRLRNFRPGGILQFLRSIWPDIREGVIYIRHSRLVISLLAMAFVPLTFGLPYMFLMPVFADKVLGQSEVGYGLLMAMAGVGALVASLTIASLGDFKQKGKLLLAMALMFGITLALFGISHSFPLSLAILVGVGAGGTGYMAINNTLLQSNVPLRILGRVMSIWMITFALMPMGTLPIGAVAQALGPTVAVTGGAIIIVLFILGMIIFVPFLRRLE